MIVNSLLALASAALLILLFPSGASQTGFAWLAPLALAPLCFACAREPEWRWRFALGYGAAIVYWCGLCNWIHLTLAQYGGVSPVVGWLLFGLFCLAKALQLGVFAALAGPILDSIFALPAIGALWVAIEWTHSYTGFEWLNLGNAGSDLSLPLRLAPITGVWGLSFVFAMMGAGVAMLALRRRLHLVWLLLLPGLFLLPEVPGPHKGDSSAILAQPNLPDDAVWSPELLDRVKQRLTLISLSPLLSHEREVDVIVWPEMPAPFYETDPAFMALARSVAKVGRAPLLTGVVGRTPARAALNSALLVAPDGKVISRYDKVHLVPFGEFVPWPFGLVTRQISAEAGEFEPGSNVVVSTLGSHRMGTFICYEAVFPSYVRQFAAGGAEVFFNISNDSWFGKSAARYQHLQIVRMRAAENQRWILRGTDNGVTVAIDPAGRIVRAAQEFEELGARFDYQYLKGLTFYTLHGDWFVLLCFILAAAACVRSAYSIL